MVLREVHCKAYSYCKVYSGVSVGLSQMKLNVSISAGRSLRAFGNRANGGRMIRQQDKTADR